MYCARDVGCVLINIDAHLILFCDLFSSSNRMRKGCANNGKKSLNHLRETLFSYQTNRTCSLTWLEPDASFGSMRSWSLWSLAEFLRLKRIVQSTSHLLITVGTNHVLSAVAHSHVMLIHISTVCASTYLSICFQWTHHRVLVRSYSYVQQKYNFHITFYSLLWLLLLFFVFSFVFICFYSYRSTFLLR